MKRKVIPSVTGKLYVSLHSKDSKKAIKERRKKRRKNLMKLKPSECVLLGNFREKRNLTKT